MEYFDHVYAVIIASVCDDADCIDISLIRQGYA